MTIKDYIEEVKYYTGLMLSEDSIKEHDILMLEKFVNKETKILEQIYTNSPDTIINSIIQEKYNYYQNKYNM